MLTGSRPGRPRLFNFQNNPIGLNLVLFATAAGVIWFAGTKLERFADAIANRTGLGHAFVGALLLAAATSLTEIATVVTAASLGNHAMAVHNLLGAVVFNTAIMAVADAITGRRGVTERTPRYVLLIQGLGVVFLLTLVLTAGAIGRGVDLPSKGPEQNIAVAIWTVGLFAAYTGILYLAYRGQTEPRWKPVGAVPSAEPRAEESPNDPDPFAEWESWRIYLAFAGASLAVLAGGYTVASTADAISHQTGMSGGFVGFTFLAIATTLPELSTAIAATRAGNDEMAFSNIFGSSAINVALLALVGGIAGAEIIALSGSPTAVFAAGAGIITTCIYLLGFLERRDRTILRMGWDSFAVLVMTIAASAGIYLLS